MQIVELSFSLPGRKFNIVTDFLGEEVVNIHRRNWKYKECIFQEHDSVGDKKRL